MTMCVFTTDFFQILSNWFFWHWKQLKRFFYLQRSLPLAQHNFCVVPKCSILNFFLFHLFFCCLVWQIKLQLVRAQQKLRKCNYLQTGEQLANRIQQNKFKGSGSKIHDPGSRIGIKDWAEQKFRKCNYLQTGEQLVNMIQPNKFKGSGSRIQDPGSESRIGQTKNSENAITSRREKQLANRTQENKFKGQIQDQDPGSRIGIKDQAERN